MAGVHCTPIKVVFFHKREVSIFLIFQAEPSNLGEQSGVVVGLTVVLSAALVVITLLSLYIASHRIAGITQRNKMKMILSLVTNLLML